MKSSKLKVSSTWTPPPYGTLKLNINGAAKGKPGPAGIGGVLRDHQDVIKGTFSHNIGIKDSNFAEFQAIHEGLKFFLASPWASNSDLEVESDSLNAILWTRDHSKVPWRMKLISNAIETLSKSIRKVTFNHISRELNNS
ncbi:Ribonuclease H domain - like 10 [Theobroma cacao]|nr:Ribonuclease H domain - like 10 [Theobroma cacao]